MISSRRNPLVKRLRSIARTGGRNESSLLLLEGTHLLKEALRTNYSPQEIIFTESWKIKNIDILSSLSQVSKVFEVTQDVLEAALSTVTPDGVASLFPISQLPLVPKKTSYILALDRLQDPGNLGNLFRTALAADIEVLWLASGVDPLNQKVIRSSSGALLHLPYERLGTSAESGIDCLVEKLTYAVQRGYQVVASAVPDEDSMESVAPYWDIDWSKDTILVLGNEGSGLHPRIKNCCTHVVTLPHSPSVQSLNVAAAAVPLLLERRRAKMDGGIPK